MPNPIPALQKAIAEARAAEKREAMIELRKALYLECKYQIVCKAYLALCHADYTSRWAFLRERPSVARYVNGPLFR